MERNISLGLLPLVPPLSTPRATLGFLHNPI
jgi:hypothetical protein